MMRYLNRFSLLLALAVMLSGCAHSKPLMPKEWGDIRTDNDNVCLKIDATFENMPSASVGDKGNEGKTLASIIFPVMKGVGVDAVSIETSDSGIVFRINGKKLIALLGEQEDGKIACTQRTWAMEASRMSNAEGAIAVEKRVLHMHLNQRNDLIVREIKARRGVGLLVVPYGGQGTVLYRFKVID